MLQTRIVNSVVGIKENIKGVKMITITNILMELKDSLAGLIDFETGYNMAGKLIIIGGRHCQKNEIMSILKSTYIDNVEIAHLTALEIMKRVQTTT